MANGVANVTCAAITPQELSAQPVSCASSDRTEITRKEAGIEVGKQRGIGDSEPLPAASGRSRSRQRADQHGQHHRHHADLEAVAERCQNSSRYRVSSGSRRRLKAVERRPRAAKYGR